AGSAGTGRPRTVHSGRILRGRTSRRAAPAGRGPFIRSNACRSAIGRVEVGMRYVRLAGSELMVSVLGLGCGNFGGIGSAPDLFGRGEDEAEAFALMDAALEHGITLFDTANSYGGGRSEEWIGRWLATRGV